MRNATVRLAASALFIFAGFVGISASPASAQSSSSTIISATSAGDVRELGTLRGHTARVASVAFSPDGRMIASGSWDNTIKLWDAASGRALRTLQGHSKEVYCVAFSPDGLTIASGSNDGTIKLWDVASGRERQTLGGQLRYVTSVAFSPDGRMIASMVYGDVIKLWDAASGRELPTLKGQEEAHSFAISPDGRTIVSANAKIQLWDAANQRWDVASGQELRTLQGRHDRIVSLAFSPDGRTIASGSWGDNIIKFWDVGSRQELRTLSQGHSEKVNSIAFSPDGRTIASGSDDKTIILWDITSGQEERTLKGHDWTVDSVAFSPDGRMLASGSGDNTIKLWGIPGRDAVSISSSLEKVEKVEKVPPAVTAITASVDSAKLAKIVAPDRRVALVIGNSAYRNVQHLANPSNDADLIGAALRSTGIEDVTVAHDLDRDGMVAALRTFARKADAADWAVIYYAGHGIEIGGINYLIPVDAKLETDRDVPEEAISLEQLQSKLLGARKLKLIVLDACRNNPFSPRMVTANRSVDRGLTRFEPTGATLVVYAAREGTTAKDGDGKDSPFAVSFASRIIQQGVEINMALRFVRQDVLLTTRNQQEPFVYGSLPPEAFYFVPPK